MENIDFNIFISCFIRVSFNQQTYLHGLLDDQLSVCILGVFIRIELVLFLKAGGSTGDLIF